jgi:hypothetical protein
VHLARVVARLGQRSDALVPALRVHPIVVAVCGVSVGFGIGVGAAARATRHSDSQMNVTGTLRLCILSTMGIRAYAPGARMWAGY